MTITARKLYAADLSALSRKTVDRLERDFFAALQVGGRVNKTTWAGRLTEIEDAIEAFVEEAGLDPFRFLDVGASSAVSTLEWFDSLKRAGRVFEMVATDIALRAAIVSVGPGMWVLADCAGRPLQYDFLGYGMRPGRARRRDLVTGAAMLSLLVGRAYKKFTRRHLQVGNQDSPTRDLCDALRGHAGVREVRLVSPRVLLQPAISVREDDIFSPVPRDMVASFDVVRVANLLNRDYFEESAILKATTRLKQCIRRPAGLVVVTRTRPSGDNHGTIFGLTAAGMLSPLRHIGAGSEIKEIVIRA